MKFVFDLDGTLSFDGVTIDDEIKQVLLRAEEFGHEVAFASARSYRDCLGLLGDPLSQQLVIGLNGGLAYRQGQLVYEEQLDKDVGKSLAFAAITIYHFLWMIPLIIADRFWKRFLLLLM